MMERQVLLYPTYVDKEEIYLTQLVYNKTAIFDVIMDKVLAWFRKQPIAKMDDVLHPKFLEYIFFMNI